MKKYILILFFSNLIFCNNLYPQCGIIDSEILILNQEDFLSYSNCESIDGNVVINGENIDSLIFSNLISINGNLNIFNTNITSIAPLSSLMNVNEINIYNNNLLDNCCSSLNWQSLIELGTISNLNIHSNSTNCSSTISINISCLGLLEGCTDSNSLNFNPLATIDDNSCLNGPDLQVSASAIINSLEISTFNSEDNCLVAEGCISGIGNRKILKFTTTISNYGNEDFYIGETGGAENLNENFYWDDCHGHAHYEGYANYKLFYYPSLEQHPTIGHKNGWCVMDLGNAVTSEAPDNANYPQCEFEYGCSIMGISAGCSDTYGSGLSCQWVDITDLYDGQYILGVSTNMETENYTPQYETNYSNNSVYILFEFENNEIISVSHFDDNSITENCTIDIDNSEFGFHISNENNFLYAFTNEFFNESIQINISDSININNDVFVIDSLIINDITNLPDSIEWNCSNENCTFYPGNSCLGIYGITTYTGEFSLIFNSTLYLSDDNDLSSIINIPNIFQNNEPDLEENLINNESSLNDLNPNFTILITDPIYGCIDSFALNFDNNSNFDDGSCIFPNIGCTDSFALNFDSFANIEDGSCEYCTEGIEWIVKMNLFDSYGDGWNGNNYYIIDDQNDTIIEGTLDDGYEGENLFCLSPGCYSISVPNENPWPYEISWELSAQGFSEVNLNGDCPDLVPFNFLSDCDFSIGCTDSSALNYDSTAVFNNEECIYPLFGCIDSSALNYNTNANYSDSSCVYPNLCNNNENSLVLFLFDSYGDGWNGNNLTLYNSSYDSIIFETTLDSGYEGIETLCLDNECYLISVTGGNWQSEITWEIKSTTDELILNGNSPLTSFFGLNSTCDSIFGCSNPSAINYNPSAGSDDFSCIFESSACEDNYNLINLELQTDPYPNETSWSITNDENDTLIFIDYYENQNALYSDSFCVPQNISLNFNLYDSYGDGLTSGAGNGEFKFFVCGLQVFSGSSFEYQFSGNFHDCEGTSISIYGCTDSIALNYNLNANYNNGSCEYGEIFGCTDEFAINFNPMANIDDDQCEYIYCDSNNHIIELNIQNTNYENNPNIEYSILSLNNQSLSYDSLSNIINFTHYYCLEAGCYIFYPNNVSENQSYSWSISSGNKKIISGDNENKTSFEISSICNLNFGCNDENALNFDYSSNYNDSTCIYNDSLVINLTDGWNMVSSYIQSENMNIINLTNNILNEIIIIKNNIGLVFIPEWNFNSIGNWSNYEGYQIKVSNNCDITFYGQALVPEENPIMLNQGWNLISYFRQNEASVEGIFSLINNNIIIVKNSIGLAYLPDWGYNGIGNFEPGQGYQIKMIINDELNYLPNNLNY